MLWYVVARVTFVKPKLYITLPICSRMFVDAFNALLKKHSLIWDTSIWNLHTERNRVSRKIWFLISLKVNYVNIDSSIGYQTSIVYYIGNCVGDMKIFKYWLSKKFNKCYGIKKFKTSIFIANLAIEKVINTYFLLFVKFLGFHAFSNYVSTWITN